jgi:tetratricopeptide (TPR) repeat protein
MLWMKPLRPIIASAFFVLHHLGAQSVSYSPETIQNALLYVDLHQGAQLLKGLPNSHRVLYFKAQRVAIQALVNDQRPGFASAIDSLDQYLNLLETNTGGPQRASKLAFGAEVYLLRAALYGRMGKNLSAVADLKSAYDGYSKSLKLDSTEVVALAGMGLMQAGVGSLPSSYQTMAALINMRGTIGDGLQMVRKAARKAHAKDHWFEQKARVLVLWSEAQFLDFPVAKLELNGIDLQRGALVRFLLLKRFLDHGEGHLAVQFLDQHPSGGHDKVFPQLDYLEGRVYLSQFRPETEKAFRTFLERYRGNNFVRSAHRYLLWHYSLQGQTEAAERERALVLGEAGGRFSGADQQAVLDATLPFNATLVKARLLYDGGALHPSLEWLLEAQTKGFSEREMAEYHYRLGRVYQKLGKVKEALTAFHQSTALKADPDVFVTANAWLQLGYLHAKIGNTTEAKKAFKACLEWEDYPFYEGVQQKARTGLSKLPS